MRKTIKLILLILCMSMLFLFSRETGTDSTNTSSAIVKIVFDIYSFIFKNDLTFEIFCKYAMPPIRKLAHFSEFALLGILAYINAKEYTNKYIIVSILFSIAYAASDEIHQLFVENRYGCFKDVCIDSLGIMVGILLIHMFEQKCIKKDS